MSGHLTLKTKNGFTLVEILVVILTIAILSTLVIVYVNGSQERTYFTRAKAEFSTIENALKLYVAKNNDYPAEVTWGLPAGLTEFIAKDARGNILTEAPYPGSIYDFENWQIDNGSGDLIDTRQISIRFCPNGGAINTCKFPKEDWAQNFGVHSALYYCIEGLCRPHNDEPATYPGYCINCPNNRAIGT